MKQETVAGDFQTAFSWISNKGFRFNTLNGLKFANDLAEISVYLRIMISLSESESKFEEISKKSRPKLKLFYGMNLGPEYRYLFMKKIEFEKSDATVS